MSRSAASAAPPPGFAGYSVISSSIGADWITKRKARLYTVISPAGRVGNLIPHGGEYRFHQQLDLFVNPRGKTMRPSFRYRVILRHGQAYETTTLREARALEAQAHQRAGRPEVENPRAAARQVALVGGRDPRNAPDGTVLARRGVEVTFDHYGGRDVYHLTQYPAQAGLPAGYDPIGQYLSLSGAVKAALNVPAYNGFAFFDLLNSYRPTYATRTVSPAVLADLRTRPFRGARGAVTTAPGAATVSRARVAAAPRGRAAAGSGAAAAYMAAIGGGAAAPAAAPAAPAAAPAAVAPAGEYGRLVIRSGEIVPNVLLSAALSTPDAPITGVTQTGAPIEQVRLSAAHNLLARLRATGRLSANNVAQENIYTSHLLLAGLLAGYRLQGVPDFLTRIAARAQAAGGAAGVAPAPAAPAPAAPAPAPQPPRMQSGGARRTAAASAAAFPKRCVGVTSSGYFGDASAADQVCDYLVTMIAPICKQPMAIGVKRRDTQYRHALYSPAALAPGGDQAAKRWYASGYEGHESGLPIFRRRRFARQHMLPGNMTDVDTGKGAGPLAYMAGVFAARFRSTDLDGVFSESGGRTYAAELAWNNAVDHGTAEVIISSPRSVTASTRDLARAAVQLSRTVTVDRSEVPRLTRQIQTEQITHFGKVDRDQPVQITGSPNVYQVITQEKVLSLGIVVHMDASAEVAVTNAFPNLRTPYCPPPAIWGELDLSNYGDNDAFLLECLAFCSTRYGAHGGNMDAADYLRTALTAMRGNPSLLPPVEWVDAQIAALDRTAGGRRNPARASRATAERTREVSAFLNDDTWSIEMAEPRGARGSRGRA